MHKYNFISGLPRSGSTLLAGLVNTFLEQVGLVANFMFFLTSLSVSSWQKLFDAYYHQEQSKRIIFDTNRILTARTYQLNELFDDFKMICCVRNPAWIMDSFERIYRKNPFDYISPRINLWSIINFYNVNKQCKK
ncbi:hypothetical protein [Catenovulum sediminis]|uniref:hypothetical protein n=1 Tax=Catenovulum sediminis TaxID=1740262 RepID=UPI001FE243C0|nr:hypothetical protein [Catenovulum sediminis]